MKAHPRACGENGRRVVLQLTPAGSSPRVRGKPARRVELDCLARLIPARAGKTRTRWRARAAPWAHPRACGENLTGKTAEADVAGSSPRVRGKRHALCPFQRRVRLIPARAGKTRTYSSASRGSAAHPRACGENSRTAPEAAETFGSSPRVRGKPTVPVVRTERTGLIPARAGKTDVERQVLRAHRAHPRACGENITLTILMPVAPGSSPRVRGKRARLHVRGLGQRLIPARAGKTPPGATAARTASAHPRACGENVTEAAADANASGSSPRVRGKH